MQPQPEGTRRELAYLSSLGPVFLGFCPTFQVHSLQLWPTEERMQSLVTTFKQNTLNKNIKYYFGVGSRILENRYLSQVWHFWCQMFSFGEHIISNQNRSPNLIGPCGGLVSAVYAKYLSYSQGLDWTMRIAIKFAILYFSLPCQNQPVQCLEHLGTL